MLAPSIKDLSFSVTAPSYKDSYLGGSPEWSEEIYSEVAEQAAVIVKRNIEKVRSGAQGDEQVRALGHYNRVIPALLAVASEGQAEELIPLFSLNDLSFFSDVDECSGYNPVENFFFDREIEERWKRKVAERMHAVITAEAEGKTTPRKEWEEAFDRYRNILGTLLYTWNEGRLPVSEDFLKSEITFMLSVKNGRPVVPWHYTEEAWDFLGDDGDLAVKLLRRQVLVDPSGESLRQEAFTVYDQKTAAFARRIREGFFEDPELEGRLREMLTSWQSRQTPPASN